jgi:uncharacterized LabA/DUF88 family protein
VILRVAAYIDGFNLYFGLKASDMRRYYWLDPHLLAVALAPAGASVVRTVYCTARISRPEPKRLRQNTYLEALQALGTCDVLFGRYQEEPVRCPACGDERRVPKEKMTDSRLVTSIVCDAFRDVYDMAVIVSADADLVPAVEAARAHFPDKRVMVALPPGRQCLDLQRACSDVRQVREHALRDSQMPDKVLKLGFALERPDSWR